MIRGNPHQAAKILSPRVEGIEVMTEQEKVAYCAGLFDGEGCISISRYRKRKSGTVWPQLQVIMVQKHPAGIDFLIKMFGGTRHPVYRHNRESAYWRWQLCSDNARYFLKKLLPYLIEKRDQAILAIDFEINKRLDSRDSSNGKPGRPGYSDEIYKIRDHFAVKLSRLKRAGAETKRQRLG